jgi:DNA (cytosine-5)-methyltransferase 1
MTKNTNKSQITSLLKTAVTSSAYKFPYEWTLKDANFTKDKGKAFSCFSCGGGSTMGYKLAGFDVIGCNEIDKKMMEVYKENHNPKFSFLESITTFAKRKDLPKELYELDILDGSPPCSSFSMAGNREKDWGKEKAFREGQAAQILDTLFFDFISLAKELQPKVVIAENVKGILMGEAKGYVRKILSDFDEAGYIVKEFCLDASLMGVPQKRERVFFIALRKDLAVKLPQNISVLFNDFPLIDLVFFESLITFDKFKQIGNNEYPVSKFYKELWEQKQYGDADFSCINGRVRDKPNTGFATNFIYNNKPCGTLTTKKDCYVLFDEPRYLSDFETKCIGSYPQDYNFNNNRPEYLIGMSVPPVMTAQISSRIYEQWLSQL